MPSRKYRVIVIAVSLILFVVSLVLPAISYISGRPNLLDVGHPAKGPGWIFLVFGWAAFVFVQVAAVAWVANVTFAASVISFARGRDRMAIRLTIISIVAGISFFPLSIYFPVLIPFSGQGETIYLPKPEIGFAAWVISFACVGVGAFFMNQREIQSRDKGAGG
ncbi:MAG TPA: hypothetical protein VIM06_10020 [Rhodanobacter sp.]